MSERKFIITDEMLGRGGFGEVYIAYDKNDISSKKTKYAAKKIPDVINDEERLNLFTNEIIISTEFTNPNLVKFYGLTEYNDYIYMIYEYCNGGDLNKYLKNYISKNNRPIGEKEVQKILKDILNGLSCLHRNNVVHHDIKPANILLQYNTDKDKNDLNINNCVFKLSDFGLSKYKNDEEKADKVYGTFTFLDPICSIYNKIELFDEDKTDIWAIGILTYRLLFSNTHPFIANEIYQKNYTQQMLNINLSQNIQKGIYFVKIEGQLSKEVLAFLDSCLKLEQSKRKSSEDLEYSWFLTRNYNNFNFVNQENFEYVIPYDFQGNMEVKFNIQNNDYIEDFLDL
jgi:serine/threonine protein kinase